MRVPRRMCVMLFMQDFDRKDDQLYLFEPKYTDNELREMNVLHQNADSFVSSIACMRGGTLVNACQRLTQKRRNY